MDLALSKDWSGWVAVMTRSNMERTTAERIEPLIEQCWVPQFLDMRNRARILFRNYVLAYTNSDEWGALFRIKGVIRVLPGLPTSAVNDLRARVNEDGFIDVYEQLEVERFVPGQKVRVTRGAFTGHFAIYKGMNADQREQALLTLLGRTAIKTFDYDDLAA